MLTFETNSENDRIEIHGDKKDLRELAEMLLDLANSDGPHHAHLMSKEWGGSELDSNKQGVDNLLYHHVKIFCWS